MKNKKVQRLIQGLCGTLMVYTLVASAPMSAFAGEMQQEYEQTVEQVHGGTFGQA